MSAINREITNLLREEFKRRQADHLVRVEPERALEQRLQVGRQRIRAVLNQLISEGLLVKHEGKGTYITPLVKNKYLNLITSPDIKLNDPFYNRLVMEMTNYAAKEGVNLIPMNMDTLANGMPNSPLLMIGRFCEEDLNTLKGMFLMMISFENYPEHEDFTQIYFDHKRIGYNAAKVLQEYNHRNIVHLTGPDRYASAHFRREGFLRAARKYSLRTEILSGKMNFQGGYKAGAAIKRLVMEQDFTAVFVANDWMAVGLLQYFKESGVAVPQQVSILSVDNIQLAGQFSPGLTTYSLDMSILVAEAFTMLNSMPADMSELPENTPWKKVTLQPVLITRETLQQNKLTENPTETRSGT